MQQSNWNQLYKEGKDIWSIKGDIPKFLRKIIKTIPYQRKSLSVLSFGCGLGFMEEIIANKGYDVTGIDISQEAIYQANKRTKIKQPPLQFYSANIFRDLGEIPLKQKYDLVLDWTMFHHINQKQHKNYKRLLLDKLKSYYTLCCLSDIDGWFLSNKRVLGGYSHHFLYKNSPKEIINLFSPELRLMRFETINFRDMYSKNILREKPKEVLDRKFDCYHFVRIQSFTNLT